MAALIRISLTRTLITKRVLLSSSNTVRMSSYLIEDPKYSWLKELGLGVQNKGVFCGEWSGNGEVCIILFSCRIFVQLANLTSKLVEDHETTCMLMT